MNPLGVCEAELAHGSLRNQLPLNTPLAQISSRAPQTKAT
jgi:hypothetical protein